MHVWSSICRSLVRASLVGVLLAGGLFLGGCSVAGQPVNNISAVRFKAHFTRYVANRKSEKYDARDTWRRYVTNEKRGHGRVKPQFDGYFKKQHEDVNSMLVTLRQWATVQ